MRASTTRLFARAITGLLVCSLGPAAWGQSRPTELDRARGHMVALEIEAAIEVLTEIDRSPETAASDRLEALLLLAECQLTLENAEPARAAARRIYELDPGFAVPDDRAPQRVIRLLEEVRAAGQQPVAVAFGQASLERDPDSGIVHLELSVARGAAAVERVLVRRLTAGGAQALEVSSRLGRHRAVLGALGPGAGVRAEAEALAPSGSTLARLGPLNLRVPGTLPAPGRTRSERDGGSFLASPWLWLTVGVVVVAGVGAVLLASAGDDCDESLEPGGTICLR